MRVNLGTIEVTDDQRRAFRQRAGRSGLATRGEIASMAQHAVLGPLAAPVARTAPGAGDTRPQPTASPTEAPEPPGASRRRDVGPPCRHCNQPAGAACHQFDAVDGAHRFNAAPWGD